LLKYALPTLWPLRHLRHNGADHPPHNTPAPEQGDLALISFTSGTSGAPKAIPRSHGFLTAQHHAVAPMLYSQQAERDLVTFPVFVLINIASGQTSVLPNWKMSRLGTLDAKQLQDWIQSQNVSRALLPPALCEKLAATNIPDGLLTVFTGGGPVFPDVLNQLQTTKPDLQVTCVYGSTEAEPIAHLDASTIGANDHAKMRSGHGLLVGHPTDDIQVRIVEDEIQVAGAHVNGGYVNPEHDIENKIKDGAVTWHRTGDAGYFDDENRLWLLGRVGSQVKVNNEQIYPFAVEVAARQWRGVRQCALMTVGDAACLVIEGDAPHIETWRMKAAELHIENLKSVKKIPMDKRHASKVDRVALEKLLSS
jgi:long-subunit acyl-CoA synthetase (AMP-forming)